VVATRHTVHRNPPAGPGGAGVTAPVCDWGKSGIPASAIRREDAEQQSDSVDGSENSGDGPQQRDESERDNRQQAFHD